MPFIGSDKARHGQVRLIDSFIAYREKAKQDTVIQAERDLAWVEYRPMTNAIKSNRKSEGKEVEHYHLSNEASMINRIVLGVTSAKFRKDNDIGKAEAIRDYLTAGQIRAITELQRADTVFINMGWDYERADNNVRAQPPLAAYRRTAPLSSISESSEPLSQWLFITKPICGCA